MERSIDPQRRFRLGELTREELQARLPHATVVIPIGATEQHGPHLPIMTDHLMAETIALRAADRARSGERVLLEPMTAVERKVVHLRLKEFEGVQTASEGTEPNRYVVVLPA